MNFYNEQRNRLIHNFLELRKANTTAALEVNTITGCLQGNSIASDEFYKLNRPIVVIGYKKGADCEIIYEKLEQDTLDYIATNICSVKMIKVDSVEDWVKRCVETGKIHFGLTVDELEGL